MLSFFCEGFLIVLHLLLLALVHARTQYIFWQDKFPRLIFRSLCAMWWSQYRFIRPKEPADKYFFPNQKLKRTVHKLILANDISDFTWPDRKKGTFDQFGKEPEKSIRSAIKQRVFTNTCCSKTFLWDNNFFVVICSYLNEHKSMFFFPLNLKISLFLLTAKKAEFIRPKTHWPKKRI